MWFNLRLPVIYFESEFWIPSNPWSITWASLYLCAVYPRKQIHARNKCKEGFIAETSADCKTWKACFSVSMQSSEWAKTNQMNQKWCREDMLWWYTMYNIHYLQFNFSGWSRKLLSVLHFIVESEGNHLECLKCSEGDRHEWTGGTSQITVTPGSWVLRETLMMNGQTMLTELWTFSWSSFLILVQ